MNPNPPYRNQSHAAPFARHSIIDGQNGGMVVSTFEHPSEWQARSRVVWNMQHTNIPAQVFAVAFNPHGVESFEFFPTQAFFWLEGDYGLVPIGQNGHGLVRMPPRPAPNALAELIIPHFRGDRRNLRVTGVQPVQNLWQVFNDPPPQQGESLSARVEYEERGRALEEEFYGVYEWVPATGGALNWGFGRLFSFRAGRGQLNPLRETFWQIASSLEPNPQWRQRYEQIVQHLNNKFMDGINGFYEELERQKVTAQRNMAYNEHLRNQRDAQVQRSIEQTREQIQERSRDRYTPQDVVGDLLRDQTPYHDPNSAAGNCHYVPGNPKKVWTDGQGSFYYTDDVTDNPNQHKNGNWVEARPVEPSR